MEIKNKKSFNDLIKSDLLQNGNFNIKLIFKKLYRLGCRNLLVEGGNDLTRSIIKDKLFNKFYLFKSPKALTKLLPHKEFYSFKSLSQKYKNKNKINMKLGKDLVTIYKK